MQTMTFDIVPGYNKSLDFSAPVALTFLMTSEDDVAWLTATKGALDPESAVRLDRSQCPLRLTWAGPLFIHSPTQNGRTIQVSLIVGGAS